MELKRGKWLKKVMFRLVGAEERKCLGGQFSNVFLSERKADQGSSSQLVVLKLGYLSFELPRRTDPLKQVNNEINILKNLGKNPFIVDLVGYSTALQIYNVLVLEHCVGTPWNLVDAKPFFADPRTEQEKIDFREEDGVRHPWRVFPIHVVKYITSAVLKALIFMHSKGILHGDLKVQNIIFSFDGTPKITDFGLSHSVKDMKKFQFFFGTIPYVPPELNIMDDAVHDEKTDVWSLGILVLFLLFGGWPVLHGFDASKRMLMAGDSLFYNHVIHYTKLKDKDHAYPDGTLMERSVWEALRLVIEKTLTYTFEDRISANELAEMHFFETFITDWDGCLADTGASESFGLARQSILDQVEILSPKL